MAGDRLSEQPGIAELRQVIVPEPDTQQTQVGGRGPTPNALRSKNDVLLGGQSQPWPLDWSVSQRVGFEMF